MKEKSNASARLPGAAVAFVATMLPLAFRPERLVHPSPWIIFFGTLAAYFTQPPLPPISVLLNDASDRRSGLLILLGVNLATIIPMVEFGYFHETVPAALSWWTAAGTGLVALGLYLRIWAIRTLGTNFTAMVNVRNDQPVIRTGPYRFLRHPSYSGIIISFAGSALLLQSAWGAGLLLAVLLPIYWYRASVEEDALVATLGVAYSDYRAQTWRFIPFVL